MTSLGSTVRSRQALIADNEAAVRRLCRTVLEEEGYRVLEATNGGELLSLAANHRPNLILVDTRLPGVDHPSLVPALRLLSPTKPTAVILLAELDDVSQVMASGDGQADDYLAKPLRPQELAARVRAVAHQNGGPGELQRCHTLVGEHARIHAQCAAETRRARQTRTLCSPHSTSDCP